MRLFRKTESESGDALEDDGAKQKDQLSPEEVPLEPPQTPPSESEPPKPPAMKWGELRRRARRLAEAMQEVPGQEDLGVILLRRQVDKWVADLLSDQHNYDDAEVESYKQCDQERLENEVSDLSTKRQAEIRGKKASHNFLSCLVGLVIIAALVMSIIALSQSKSLHQVFHAQSNTLKAMSKDLNDVQEKIIYLGKSDNAKNTSISGLDDRVTIVESRVSSQGSRITRVHKTLGDSIQQIADTLSEFQKEWLAIKGGSSTPAAPPSATPTPTSSKPVSKSGLAISSWPTKPTHDRTPKDGRFTGYILNRTNNPIQCTVTQDGKAISNFQIAPNNYGELIVKGKDTYFDFYGGEEDTASVALPKDVITADGAMYSNANPKHIYSFGIAVARQ